ncbi:hypothetical protein JZ751_006205 [Albula glossodonta]|uniref:BCMA TALL-1 binding domain-containing protein n=1 Tax=Albula glossodonta TaxID=121402 RepID=A0A8T2NBC0_9TELE|nr:hypothetical protein JZ751_006205 [Albula glossodonta]
MAKSKCLQNTFYDGLVEKCMPCHLRCSKPPSSCSAFCTKSSDSLDSQNYNLWLILVFLLLCAITAVMLLLRVLRKYRCQAFPRKRGRNQEQEEDLGSERDLEASRETDLANDRNIITEESELNYSGTHYSSSLPLPSTEEGTTILVTTKTAQISSYAQYCTQDNTLDVCRSVTVF